MICVKSCTIWLLNVTCVILNNFVRLKFTDPFFLSRTPNYTVHLLLQRLRFREHECQHSFLSFGSFRRALAALCFFFLSRRCFFRNARCNLHIRKVQYIIRKLRALRRVFNLQTSLTTIDHRSNLSSPVIRLLLADRVAKNKGKFATVNAFAIVDDEFCPRSGFVAATDR